MIPLKDLLRNYFAIRNMQTLKRFCFLRVVIKRQQFIYYSNTEKFAVEKLCLISVHSFAFFVQFVIFCVYSYTTFLLF